MSDFFFARSQMAMSLAFHIIFAALGTGMPLLMAFAEGMYLRTRQPVYLDLTKRWAKGTAIFFAVGAVSGTVLSFELGLLWPHFMQLAGAVIGMPFRSGSDEALGQGYGDLLRRRRGLGHRPLIRARPPLAAFHAAGGRRHRHAVQIWI